MLPTHDRAHTHARTRPRKVTYSSKQTEHSRQSILGGDCPCRLCPVRNVVRCASFLTVLGTQCISRSFSLPPQCMLASLAAVSVWRLPAPRHTHTQSRPSGCAIKRHTRTQHAVWASPQSRSARLHRMRVAGNTLEASCCRTCRRHCAKRRLRRLLAADCGWARGCDVWRRTWAGRSSGTVM